MQSLQYIWTMLKYIRSLIYAQKQRLDECERFKYSKAKTKKKAVAYAIVT